LTSPEGISSDFISPKETFIYEECGEATVEYRRSATI